MATILTVDQCILGATGDQLDRLAVALLVIPRSHRDLKVLGDASSRSIVKRAWKNDGKWMCNCDQALNAKSFIPVLLFIFV